MALNQTPTVSRWTTLLRWFDSYHGNDDDTEQGVSGIDWLRTIPFVGMHVAALSVFWVGWSPFAVGATIVLSALRMFAITFLAHVIGHRRNDTPDNSRNHFILALITSGEGWHNNQHFYPSSVRQGFRWWELDLTYYILEVFQMLGLVGDMRPVPARVLKANSISSLPESKRGKAI